MTHLSTRNMANVPWHGFTSATLQISCLSSNWSHKSLLKRKLSMEFRWHWTWMVRWCEHRSSTIHNLVQRYKQADVNYKPAMLPQEEIPAHGCIYPIYFWQESCKRYVVNRSRNWQVGAQTAAWVPLHHFILFLSDKLYFSYMKKIK